MEPSAAAHRETSLVQRHFTCEDKSPLDQIPWTIRTARAGDFVQEDVVAPAFWSDNAVGVVAKLFFATVDGEREISVRQMIERVAHKITDEGIRHGYFQTPMGQPIRIGDSSSAEAFYDELCYLLVHQMATFNSPVWFNVGVPGRPQCCSACFLLRVDDTMFGKGGQVDPHSIVAWWANEAKIFKMGAGSGVNTSKIRASMEPLSTGGVASGPLAYIRASDTNAGTLKSGGAHRRAAKMVCYDVDHPDIEDLIDSKPREDRRMRILKDAGEEIDPFTPSGERTIAETTSFQNENQSVCVTDRFMEKAQFGSTLDWPLLARSQHDDEGNREVIDFATSKDLLRQIADAAWTCGDPGMIFIDAVNRMHTTPSLGPITTCNPCGETWLNDDSSCNLASLNLVSFLDAQGCLQIEDYRRAIDVMVLAMDITCSFSDLPTPEITRNTRELRQLGLGYANLGAALMVQGLSYDSDEGRDWAASVTALLTGRAYRRSAKIAAAMGPYVRFDENRDAHLSVMHRHHGAIPDDKRDDGKIWDAADFDWREAISGGIEHGYRNSQVTVIPPTGTTSFMLGCDSTGCEPLFSLTGTKGLAGGGSMTFAAGVVRRGVEKLGYTYEGDHDLAYIENTGYPDVMAKHKPVFACANDIAPEGHVKMVAAIQPFLSGAPSKTVNLPESATIEDIERLYVLAWKLDCKAITVFRHNSKVTSILDHGAKAALNEEEPASREKDAGSEHERGETVQGDFTTSPLASNERHQLPRDVRSLRHKMMVGDHKAYIHVGCYDDGAPGELFVSSAGSEGSFVQGMWSALAKVTSLALQYGVPLEALVHQLANDEFEPKGATGNPDIPEAKSMVSYAFRWLALQFLDVDEQEALGILSPQVKARLTARLDEQEHRHIWEQQAIDVAEQPEFLSQQIAPLLTTSNGHAYEQATMPCRECGGIMRQTGACWTCQSCGLNTGCG